MANDPISSKTLTLPIIYAHWIAALQRPPHTSLAALRRLINSIIKHGVNHGAQCGESTLLPRQHFALLFLDLCLTHAYLGDYWLAITVADAAVGLYPTFAINLFARGLCKAELGQWRKARRDFKRCLRCFESAGRRLERIPYKIHQSELTSRTGLGEEWVLEWAKVHWNFKVALIEGGSRSKAQPPAKSGQSLNGIPAGVHMGPGWEAKLELFDPVYFDVVASAYSKLSPLSVSSKSTDDDNEEVYGSWKSDSTLAYYDSKPLPPIPEGPATPIEHNTPLLTVTLPTVRVLSYCPTPRDKYPQTSPSSKRNSTRADHLAKETWTPLMPPRVSLDSPLQPYFPHGSPEPYKSENDVWWQGTEQLGSPRPYRRESSIDDVIAEWIADSDDFDGTLAEGRALGIYLDKYPDEDGTESSAESESGCTIRDDDSDIYKAHSYPNPSQNYSEGHENATWHGQDSQRLVADLLMPIEQPTRKGKEKEVPTHLFMPLGNCSKDVNEKGEQILLPKAFEGYPEDNERRKRYWAEYLWNFPASEYMVKRYQP